MSDQQIQEVVSKVQTNQDQGNMVYLGKWFTAILEEQRQQTKCLKNISTVATIFGLMAVLSIILGACSVLMNLGRF